MTTSKPRSLKATRWTGQESVLLPPGTQDAEPESSIWPMSLLWPPGVDRAGVALSASAAGDLALDRIVHALDVDGRHHRVIRDTLYTLCTDAATIEYRQEILGDLLRSPDLLDSLRALLPGLASLVEPRSTRWPGSDSPLVEVMMRLGELDQYITCIDGMLAALNAARGIRSSGLLRLKEGVRQLAKEPEVCALRQELPELQELIGVASSVTVGLNLGPDLQPESITIVDLNRYRFAGPRSLLRRLLPGAAPAGRTGRTPIHEVGPVSIRKDSQLYRDLQKLLEAATAPLARALARYRDVHTGPLAALEGELAFLTGAATLFARLESAGVSVCRPEIAPASEGAFTLHQTVNLALGLQMLGTDRGQSLERRLVANDVLFDPGTRLLLLTGPNRGGKTTYCRAIGQAQVLFQAGLYVPGTEARLSLSDGVWTHFPLPEVDVAGVGRLDEEVERLRQIFTSATAASLIILNEPLTSTSERGALTIATDMVRALQLLGARTILVTHLHELARMIPQLNEQGPPGCGVGSLVAEASTHEDVVRSTFKIVQGAPIGRSYSHEIARQHGMTYEQLQQLLEERAAGAADPSA